MRKLEEIDETEIPVNHGENFLFSMLGAVCAIVVSLAVFSDSKPTYKPKYRRPAAVSFSAEDVDPRSFIPFLL